jgi:chorismate--pyruvate lyase
MTQSRFGKHHNEPVWRNRRRLIGAAIPVELSPWLFDSGSLTQRLIESCPGEFRVTLLSQGWGRPLLNEARRLGMRASQNALIRQVHLSCDGVPWVFARTVIPPRTLRGPQRRLAHLGNKSLGAVLFADKSMRRTELEIAAIAKGQQIYTLATQHMGAESRKIWGRRSVFSLHNHPLLVSEIFLPQLGPYRART